MDLAHHDTCRGCIRVGESLFFLVNSLKAFVYVTLLSLEFYIRALWSAGVTHTVSSISNITPYVAPNIRFVDRPFRILAL